MEGWQQEIKNAGFQLTAGILRETGNAVTSTKIQKRLLDQHQCIENTENMTEPQIGWPTSGQGVKTKTWSCEERFCILKIRESI